MSDDELVAFILHSRERGRTDEQVIRALTSVGWHKERVEAAFAKVVAQAKAGQQGVEEFSSPETQEAQPARIMIQEKEGAAQAQQPYALQQAAGQKSAAPLSNLNSLFRAIPNPFSKRGGVQQLAQPDLGQGAQTRRQAGGWLPRIPFLSGRKQQQTAEAKAQQPVRPGAQNAESVITGPAPQQPAAAGAAPLQQLATSDAPSGPPPASGARISPPKLPALQQAQEQRTELAQGGKPAQAQEQKERTQAMGQPGAKPYLKPLWPSEGHDADETGGAQAGEIQAQPAEAQAASPAQNSVVAKIAEAVSQLLKRSNWPFIAAAILLLVAAVVMGNFLFIPKSAPIIAPAAQIAQEPPLPQGEATPSSDGEIAGSENATGENTSSQQGGGENESQAAGQSGPAPALPVNETQNDSGQGQATMPAQEQPMPVVQEPLPQHQDSPAAQPQAPAPGPESGPAYARFAKFTTTGPYEAEEFCSLQQNGSFYRAHYRGYYGGECISEKAVEGFANASVVRGACVYLPCCINGPLNEYSTKYDWFECAYSS